jgi:hypothetical protein
MRDHSPQYDFAHWWSTEGPWVEEPNVRRSGTSGVQRVMHEGSIVYVKRQTGHLYRSARHPFGRPTVLREGHALASLHSLNVSAPNPVFYGARKVDGVWQGLLVTKDLGEFQDLDSWYHAGGQDRYSPEENMRLFEQLAFLLSRMHLSRWQHGCMRSKHIFVKVQSTDDGPDFQLALLDLEKSRRRFSSLRAARHDIFQLRRHSPWSDAQWQYFLKHYEAELGRTLSKGESARSIA